MQKSELPERMTSVKKSLASLAVNINSNDINGHIAFEQSIQAVDKVLNEGYEAAMGKTSQIGAGNPVGIYIYLRDNFGAKKVDEAREMISKGVVDVKIVRVWLEEGLLLRNPEYHAAIKGYPLLEDELKFAYDQDALRISRL